MPKLFSYVVHHDVGIAPHPYGRLCTLCQCKYGSRKKRNIVELAVVGDWIAGTGGADLRKSAGHGKLIYAMRVDEKVSLAEYYEKNGNRIDANHDVVNIDDRFALKSRHFFYFGRDAVKIPQKFLNHAIEKRGPGYRRKFTDEFVKGFVTWLESTFKVGVHGPPCQPDLGFRMLKCPSKVSRTRCQ